MRGRVILFHDGDLGLVDYFGYVLSERAKQNGYSFHISQTVDNLYSSRDLFSTMNVTLSRQAFDRKDARVIQELARGCDHQQVYLIPTSAPSFARDIGDVEHYQESYAASMQPNARKHVAAAALELSGEELDLLLAECPNCDSLLSLLNCKRIIELAGQAADSESLSPRGPRPSKSPITHPKRLQRWARLHQLEANAEWEADPPLLTLSKAAEGFRSSGNYLFLKNLYKTDQSFKLSRTRSVHNDIARTVETH